MNTDKENKEKNNKGEEDADEKLEDLVCAFLEKCKDTFMKVAHEMAEADQKMEEYQKKVEEMKGDVESEIKTSERDMQQVKQALTDLCQSI